MKKQYIYSALILTAVLTAGCAKEDENLKLNDGNSSAIELSSVSTDPMTKAVITGTSFTTNEAEAGIGLFLLDTDGNAYGANPANVKYTFSSDKWTAASPLRVGNTKGSLYGYYPYSSSAADITAIPVSSSVNGTDWLYATPVEVTTSNAKSVSLSLDHALARVSLSFKLDASYVGDGVLSGISLSGDCVAASGTLDATDGSIEATASKFTASTEQTLSKSTSTILECLVVPVIASGTPEFTVFCTIDGKAYAKTFTGDIAALAQGNQTSIEFKVLNTSIEVDGSSIGAWGDGGSQTVVVGGNHTVTINLAKDITAHDVLTDVYVDGNSVIIRASSCSGEHLKCIMDNGEFCTSQSKTNNLVYTFTISDITSDETATIEYADAVSLIISPSEKAGSVEISGGELYEGETITFKATPIYETEFIAWKDGSGNVIGEEYEESTILDSGCIVAEFKYNLILDGEFTVNENGKKINFTRGNLFRENYINKIERNQYDFNAADYTSPSGHVSHFLWCNDCSDASSEIFKGVWDGQTTFFTEDTGFSVSGFDDSCRTLTKEELLYLFGSNTVRSGKYRIGVTVCNKENCVVLLPDDWTWGTNEDKDEYNYVEWKHMEAAGAVCLPAAGYREAVSENRTPKVIQHPYEVGYYWSAIPVGTIDAYCLYFSEDILIPAGCGGRDRAFAVRLVTDVK